MNANRSTVSDSRRVIFIIGLLTAIATAGFFLLPKRAAMQSGAPPIFDSTAQPNALGRLAFQRTNFFTSGSANVSLLAVNSDGTGLTTLAAAGTPPLFCGEPSYAKNGTRIAYTQDADIYVMNADGSNKINLTNNGTALIERNPSWNGSSGIVYERDNQIWTMEYDGTNQAQFLPITQPSPTAPAWSPDGSDLAFASGGEIWVIKSNGTQERRVTNNSTIDADPAWSPDGRKIIFGKGGSGIAVINFDGTNETNLTTNATDSKPAWSADGTRIAFVRRTGADGGIFTMDANGANQIRVVADITTQPGRNENDNPAWQPVLAPPFTSLISGRITRGGASLSGVTVSLSGTTTATTTTDALGYYQFNNLAQGNYTVMPQLANFIFTPPRRIFTNLTANQTADFTAAETCSTPGCSVNGKVVFVRGSNIYTASIDGSNAVALTNVQHDNEPAWSPDGSKIVFESRRDSLTAREIYSINADGTNLVRLTNNTFEDFYPSFSPDGTKILFVSKRDGSGEIYTMNIDGTNPVRLTNNATEENYPVYSPDGAKIVFSAVASNVGGLFTMNADGSNIVRTTTATGGRLDTTPAFSPDGSKIVFTRAFDGPSTIEIYTVNADGTNQTLLIPANLNFKPSYSPDGTKIIYSHYTNQYEVRTISVSGGEDQLLFMNGNRLDWQPIRPTTRPAQFDFDGDGKSDIAVFRPSNGVWYRLNSQNTSFSAEQFGIASDKIAPADYDGDGKTDIAVFRQGAFGYFYILDSSNNTFRYEQFGTTGDVPVPADWDGDGRADLAVFRGGSSGSNYYYRPTTDSSVSYHSIINGIPGKPILGDFDGDGKNDPTVLYQSNGWRISYSSGIPNVLVNFGMTTDIPVPADFDGDGKTNIAVFRPSTGTWYTSQNPATNYGAIPFGQAGDVPVPADYDGDGRADAAVYRGGAWYLLRSTAGFTGVAFGAADDKPIPNSFVPDAFVP